MKKLFNEKKRLLKELNTVGYFLDQEIQKRWNFHYTQTDNDPMIDTLDYGTSSISYVEFVELMNDYKKRQKNNEWTPND